MRGRKADAAEGCCQLVDVHVGGALVVRKRGKGEAVGANWGVPGIADMIRC